ncbi:hypothetical protein [Pseudanabaena sp. ABRG5-3]|nr:hypothetical protein [Pseudanabaena sp. ABRG5-3]
MESPRKELMARSHQIGNALPLTTNSNFKFPKCHLSNNLRRLSSNSMIF